MAHTLCHKVFSSTTSMAVATESACQWLNAVNLVPEFILQNTARCPGNQHDYYHVTVWYEDGIEPV